MGLFQTMRNSASALSAFQIASEIISNNIANANTPGYVRQKPVLQENPAYPSSFGTIGTGVNIAEIKRVSDVLVQRQMEKQIPVNSYWKEKSTYYGQLEQVLQEPSDENINARLMLFWASWEKLSVMPESFAARAEVMNHGQILTDTFRHLHEQLDSTVRHLNQSISLTVPEINSLSEQLALVNAMIFQESSSGNISNDLLTRQEKIIGEIAEICNINVRKNADATADVFLGSAPLVSKLTAFELEAVQGSGGIYRLQWAHNGKEVNMTGGKMKAWMDMRDDIIPDYLDRLDTIAFNIVSEINALHTAGFGLDGAAGNNFFAPLAVAANASRDISLDPGLTANGIAAADAPGEPGNNKTVLAIAALQSGSIAGLGNTTFAEYYNSIITKLGTDSKFSIDTSDAQASIFRSIQTLQQSVSGVNLDEEVAYLLQYQYAYQAAAKVISVASEMLETVIRMY